MELHTASSRSRVDPRSIWGSPTDEPLEQNLNLPISRKYDIWSLGCVYLEFVTWLLSGPTGIRSFADARCSQNPVNEMDEDTFFTLLAPDSGGESGDVKDSVSQHIAALRDHDEGSPALQKHLSNSKEHDVPSTGGNIQEEEAGESSSAHMRDSASAHRNLDFDASSESTAFETEPLLFGEARIPYPRFYLHRPYWNGTRSTALFRVSLFILVSLELESSTMPYKSSIPIIPDVTCEYKRREYPKFRPSIRIPIFLLYSIVSRQSRFRLRRPSYPQGSQYDMGWVKISSDYTCSSYSSSDICLEYRNACTSPYWGV